MQAMAIAVEKSGNEKTGKVSATYVTQSACPTSCKFRDSGCYAESGHVAFTTRRLNAAAAAEIHTPESIAVQEAAAIRGLSGKLPLRVHVVGDCLTDESAKIVSEAMTEHTAKQGQPSWTYTHAWRDVDVSSWNGASVQASCETAADVELAHSRGYATAVVVDSFTSDKRYTTADGIDVIPCPQQTGKSANCASCQLCMGPAVERRKETGVSIGFAVHGARKAAAVQAISR